MLRLLAPVVLIGAILYFVDLGTALTSVARASPLWIMAGLGVIQLQIVLSAVRWQLTAEQLGHRLTYGLVVREYYLATLLNQILPGGMAGDAARVVRNGREASLSQVGQGVFIERLAGQLALSVVLAIGLVLWPLLVDSSPPRAGVMGLAALLGMLLFALMLLWCVRRFGSGRWQDRVDRIVPALRRCWLHDNAWIVQGVLSLAIVATYLAVFWIASRSLAEPLPLRAVLTLVPLALFSMLIPVTPGGWGVREVSAAALWPLVGLSSEAGLATGLLYGLISLVGSLPGLFFVLRPSRDALASLPTAPDRPAGD